MKIKQYEAENLRACLEQVRNELGPEAVILETQKVAKSGMLGLQKREGVRVLAGVGLNVAEKSSQAVGATAIADQEPVRPTQPPLPPQGKQSAGDFAQVARLERELRELKAVVAAVTQPATTPAPPVGLPMPTQPTRQPLRVPALTSRLDSPAPTRIRNGEGSEELSQLLIDADVDPKLAKRLMAQMPDLSGWQGAARQGMGISALKSILVRQIDCSGPIELTPGRCKAVAVVGPTGVGKTTTLAKLAAHYALSEKKRVGLITVDTYRIAAIEQLRTYAEIINVPLAIVQHADELPKTLSEFAAYDLVLIDTAGRSQKHGAHVSELDTLMKGIDCEVHLALCASTKRADLLEQWTRFSPVGVHRILFTKLDETSTYGSIFSLATLAETPISYLTTGQRVPEDIETANASRLASLVLEATRQLVQAA